MGAGEFDEVNVTEDDFDDMIASSVPVTVRTQPAGVKRRRTFEDYYTMTRSSPGLVATTGGERSGARRLVVTRGPAVSSRL